MKMLTIIFCGGIVVATLVLSLIYVSSSVLKNEKVLYNVQDAVDYPELSYKYFESELRELLNVYNINDSTTEKIISEDELRIGLQLGTQHRMNFFVNQQKSFELSESQIESGKLLISQRLFEIYPYIHEITRNELAEDINDILLETIFYWDAGLPSYEILQLVFRLLEPIVAVLITIAGSLCVANLWWIAKQGNQNFYFIMFATLFIVGLTLVVTFFSLHEITHSDLMIELELIRQHFIQAIAYEIIQRLYELGNLIMGVAIATFGILAFFFDMASVGSVEKKHYSYRTIPRS